jgi:hypothetical protein
MADDYEKLLADVERSLGGSAPAPSTKPAKRRGAHPAAPAEAAPAPRSRLTTNARNAVVSGGVAAVAIYVLFMFVPFLRAASGAWGAFLATTLAVFLTSYVRRS